MSYCSNIIKCFLIGKIGKYGNIFFENLNFFFFSEIALKCLEFVSEELNHLAAILQHYAGCLIFMNF
jgi:hypothetical protein